MSETLELDWGGQGCHIKIIKRDDRRASGSEAVFVSFYGSPGYGYPSLELSELQALLKRAENMASNG